MSSFYNLFNYIDIFRIPLSFGLNKKDKISTITGKIFSLVLFVFLLYSFIISDCVNKTNAQSISQDIFQQQRPQMSFSKQNMTMVFGIADDDNNFYIDEQIFSMIFYTYKSNSSNTNIEQIVYTLQPCVSGDFKENPSEFEELSLNGSFCVPDQILTLAGYWDEQNIQYFFLDLVLCQNSTNSSIICKSPDEISQFFAEKYIDIYLTNHNIHTSNYLQSVQRSLKMYYQQLDLNIKKIMNFYIKQAIIDTDDGFYFENLHQIETYVQGEIDYDMTLRNNPNDNNVIYELSFYSSTEQISVTRNYQKIQILLAQLGGICNFFFFFGILFCKMENRYRMVSLLTNELYSFPRLDLSDKENSKEGNKNAPPDPRHKINFSVSSNNFPSNTEITYTNLKSDQVNQVILPMEQINHIVPKTLQSRLLTTSSNCDIQQTTDEKTFEEKKENIKENTEIEMMPLNNQKSDDAIMTSEALMKVEKTQTSISNRESSSPNEQEIIDKYSEFYKKIHKQKKFDMGYLRYLKVLLKNKSCCLNNDEKMYLQGENEISEEMDILKIMKKLQEIDKLKKILLSEEQLYFFNLIDKQMISLENYGISAEKEVWTFKPEIFKKNYELLSQKAGESEVDERILKLLQEHYFSVSKNIFSFRKK